MSRLSSQSPSKARFRGKMLIAWFSDANPPVLWRWQASDLSGGFGIHSENGEAELLKYEGNASPVVIARFTSVDKAERALERLSRALLKREYGSTGRAWKLTLAVAALLLLLLLLRIYVLGPMPNSPTQTAAQLPPRQSALPTTAPPPAVPNIPGFPTVPSVGPNQAAPASSQPPQGAPVDVDSFYH